MPEYPEGFFAGREDPDGTHMLVPVEVWERRIRDAYDEGHDHAHYKTGGWWCSDARASLAEIGGEDE